MSIEFKIYFLVWMAWWVEDMGYCYLLQGLGNGKDSNRYDRSLGVLEREFPEAFQNDLNQKVGSGYNRSSKADKISTTSKSSSNTYSRKHVSSKSGQGVRVWKHTTARPKTYRSTAKFNDSPRNGDTQTRKIQQQKQRIEQITYIIHHIISLTLLLSAYIMHFTALAHLLLLTFDVTDIFLPLAKTFQYLNLKHERDSFFSLFCISWFLTRHWIFTSIYLSIVLDSKTMIPQNRHTFRPWTLGSWYHGWVYIYYVTILGGLQLLMVRWGWLVVKAVYKALRPGGEVGDVRSDDEGCDCSTGDDEFENDDGDKDHDNKDGGF
jgi:hypothetical protein